MRHQGLKRLFLMLLILASCAAPGSDNPAEGCGGTEASVSCLEVGRVIPTSTVGGDSSNVDAFRVLCVDNTGNVTGAEDFTDHGASISLVNRLFPTSRTGTGFDIRITGYSVSYRLNQCPNAAVGCPPLTGFTVSGESIFVPNGQTVTTTLPFVPLRVKNEFCAAGGERGQAMPSYTDLHV